MSTPHTASITQPEPNFVPVNGTLRDCTPGGKGNRKLRSGEIAVIDSVGLTKREAQQFIAARPAAVINLNRFVSETVPNFGPLLLIEAGIELVEDAGAEFFAQLKDGTRKGAIDPDGTISAGKKVLGQGTRVSEEAAQSAFEEAQQTLIDSVAAFSGNTIEFVHAEAPLLIDGIGIPEVGDLFQDRKVLVVGPGVEHRQQLRQLGNFIREYSPLLVGVEEGADTLVEADLKPDFIVGNPAKVNAETLQSNARVILPADPDGHADGLERIQDLGIGAMTFPAVTDSPTDLALLLAGYHGAQLIVLAGAPMNLDDIFARAPHATPATMLTRLKLGGRLVDAQVIIDLYNLHSGRGMAWLWALLGILVAIAVVILVVGLGGDDTFSNNLINTWNNIVLTVQGWF